MRYILIIDIDKDSLEENFRLANAITWADDVLEKLPDGNYKIVKGEYAGTIVTKENFYASL